MPRTEITVNKLRRNGSTSNVIKTPIDAANGMQVASDYPEYLVLMIENTGAVDAAVALAAAAGLEGSQVTVPAGGRAFVGPIYDSYTFDQGNKLHVNFSLGMTGDVTALRLRSDWAAK